MGAAFSVHSKKKSTGATQKAVGLCEEEQAYCFAPTEAPQQLLVAAEIGRQLVTCCAPWEFRRK